MNTSGLANRASVVWIRTILLLPTGVFAAITVLTHAARILDIQFRIYALVSAVVALLVLAGWILIARLERQRIRDHDTGVLLGLLLLAAAGAVMASIYKLPDADDFSYVPDAVHYLSHPGDPMGNTIHYVYPSDGPILSVVVATSAPFEYAQALLSLLISTEFITVYHVVAPALVGFSIPLVLFLLLAQFADNSQDAALATWIGVAVLILLGETKYSPGSLSFTRAFQGKVVLLSAGLPLFSALSLDYLREPSLKRFAFAATAGTALAGLSSTAFFMVPMLALGLGLAHELAGGFERHSFSKLATFGGTVTYPVVYGLYASRSVTNYTALDNPLMRDWPTEFAGHLRLLLDPTRPVSPVVLLVSLMLVVLVLKGFRRRFLALWVIVDLALFLNPLVARFWIEFVTGPSIYWRVFLLLPLLAMVGAVTIGLFERMPGPGRGRKSLLAGLSVAVLALIHFVPGTTSIFKRGGEIGLPGYRVPGEALAVARTLIELAPPGVTLAPPDIAGVTGMLRGGYPQVHLGKDPLREWLPWDEAEARAGASFFVAGDGSRWEDFVLVVEALEELRTIVIDEDRIPDVSEVLDTQGFLRLTSAGGYVIYSR